MASRGRARRFGIYGTVYTGNMLKENQPAGEEKSINCEQCRAGVEKLEDFMNKLKNLWI